MSFQQTPYTVPLLISGGISCLLAAYVLVRSRRTQSVPSVVPFAATALSGAVWSIAYAFQVASATLSDKIFWSRFVWLGAGTVTTAWFVFVLAYTGRTNWLTQRTLAVLALEPAAIVVSIWTNSAHRLIVEDVGLVDVGSFTMISAEFGPLFSVHLAYSYLLNLVGVVMLASFVRRADRPYRRQGMALLISVLVTLIASIATITGVVSSPHFDFTPLSFVASNVIIAWALVRYDLFDVVPVALGTVVDAVPDGIVVLDAEGRIVFANDVARSAFEDDNTAVGLPAETAFESHPRMAQLATGEKKTPVTIEVGSGGMTQFFEARAVQFDDPRLDGQLIVLRNVTESENVERRFQTLIERSSDAFVVLDEMGTMQYVSPSVERLLGYRPSELEGELSFDLVHPDDSESITSAFGSVLAGEMVRVEFRIRHRDDTWRTFEASASNMLDEPAVEGIVITARDVTDRRRYEQRLQVLNRVLRHDLRNDVNVIQGYTDLLAKEATAPEAEMWANVVAEKCDELIGMSEKARDIDYTLHREVTGQEIVDVAGRLDSMVERARQNYGDVRFEFVADECAWAYADPLIDSAFDNLIENAVVHNDRPDPGVRVAVSRAHENGVEYVDLSVTDNGPGIAAGERRVLEDGVETQLQHASGLGLWLVNWIVEESNGELRITDDDSGGSAVTVRLRAAEPPTRD